jgi:hypothetical protein
MGIVFRATFNAPYNFHLKVKLSSCLIKHQDIKTMEVCSIKLPSSVVRFTNRPPYPLWLEAEWAAEPVSTLPRIKPWSIDSPASRVHTVSQISVTLSADPSTKFNSQSVSTFRGKALPLSLYPEKFCTKTHKIARFDVLTAILLMIQIF